LDCQRCAVDERGERLPVLQVCGLECGRVVDVVAANARQQRLVAGGEEFRGAFEAELLCKLGEGLVGGVAGGERARRAGWEALGSAAQRPGAHDAGWRRVARSTIKPKPAAAARAGSAKGSPPAGARFRQTGPNRAWGDGGPQ
jgi:hypothetical protein